VDLGRAGDIALLQLYVPAWEALAPAQRVLAWHLSLAAIAGDPITYDQRYARNLELLALFEGILARGAAVEPEVLGELRAFLLQLWLHHGLHDQAGRKLAPGFGFDELNMAALSVFAAGERFGFLDEAQLRAALDDLRGPLFEPGTDEWLVPPAPPEGEDVLSAGVLNLYGADVGLDDLEGLRERRPHNASVVRNADGVLTEQVWRAGRDEYAPGLYAPQLRRVLGHLREALAVAGEPQREALEPLVEFLETGDAERWREHQALWALLDEPVDAVLGFVETDEDPRGLKGLWEGLVLVRDEARTARLRALAADADAFLDEAPWPADLPRPAAPEPDGPRAAVERPTAYQVLTATGDAAFFTPAAVSLPNDPAVRRDAGARGLQLVNVDDALRAVYLEPALREFACDEAEAAEARRCGDDAWQTLTALHDVLGHAALAPPPGEAATGVTLAEYAGVLAEARADLLALHFVEDPRLVALGFLPDHACGEAAQRDYVRGTFPLLRTQASDVLQGDGRRAHLLVVRYAIERGAVLVERSGGKTRLRLPDLAAWHAVVDELLAAVERIRAEGDYDAARALAETYGTQIPEGWREEAARRAELAGLPARFAFVPPSLEPVRDAAGTVVDARLVAPVDVETLLMSWKAVAEEPLPPLPPPAPADPPPGDGDVDDPEDEDDSEDEDEDDPAAGGPDD
jgi:dipeptidyl-peptidase-3